MLAEQAVEPHHARALRLQGEHAGLHLREDLRGVGRAGAEHDLNVRVDPTDRRKQVGQALLPGDPADEDDAAAVGVDAERTDDVRLVDAGPALEVDPVVHDVHPFRIDVRVAAQDVAAASPR